MTSGRAEHRRLLMSCCGDRTLFPTHARLWKGFLRWIQNAGLLLFTLLYKI
ncbi:MAG TPA: hypothetical protein V6D25_05330 [Leptolyngbyaceae cyanobacterium]